MNVQILHTHLTFEWNKAPAEPLRFVLFFLVTVSRSDAIVVKKSQNLPQETKTHSVYSVDCTLLLFPYTIKLNPFFSWAVPMLTSYWHIDSDRWLVREFAPGRVVT